MSKPTCPKSSLLSSVDAEGGADRLLEKLQNRSLGLPILPNFFIRYTGKVEEEDYKSYCRFIASSNGQKLLKRLEAQDDREIVGLY